MGGEKLRTEIRKVFPISAHFTLGGLSNKNHSVLHLVSTCIVPETLYRLHLNLQDSTGTC